MFSDPIDQSDLNSLSINSLSVLYSYFKHLSDSTISPSNYGSKDLYTAHSKNSCLVFDKHFDSIYPDPQLEYVLESQGIFDYSARLSENEEYKHVICDHDGDYSELFYPNVVGDHYNPYIRYKSSSICGSQQCSKLLDLVGIDIKDFTDPAFHESVFSDITLSYPYEIDQLLLDEKYRSRFHHRITKSSKLGKHNLIDRMNRCFSKFFKDLHNLLNIDRDHVLGCCDRLHIWSSEIPLMPNAHHHLILPHFTYYKNISSTNRSDIDFWVSDPLFDEYKDCVSTVRSKGNSLHVNHDSEIEGIRIQSSKVEYTDHRFIADRSLYNKFRLNLSNALSTHLGYEPLPWFGLIKKNDSLSCIAVPLDVSKLKDLWKKHVVLEFSDLLSDPSNIDVDIHIQFYPHDQKPKILHALQYQTRPAVGDLDLFFKKCDSVILDYSSIDLSRVHDYLQDLFVSAVLKENISKSNRYESMLSKFEDLTSCYSEKDFYSWIQFLSVWNTQTKVRGFWRNIKRYMLDPDHNFLIDEDPCPLCNGSVSHLRYVSNPVVDHVIIRNKSDVSIFDFDGSIVNSNFCCIGVDPPP